MIKDYLKSNKWREFKDSVISQRDYKCDHCGKVNGCAARLKCQSSYKTENPDNVEVFCRDCKNIKTISIKPKWNFVSAERKIRLDKAMNAWIGA